MINVLDSKRVKRTFGWQLYRPKIPVLKQLFELQTEILYTGSYHKTMCVEVTNINIHSLLPIRTTAYTYFVGRGVGVHLVTSIDALNKSEFIIDKQ